MEKALALLQTYTWGDDRNALKPIDDAIVASHGDAAKRGEIEESLLGVLKGDGTGGGKEYVCRQLKIIGTNASVPALKSMLGNDVRSHMARFALQSIPGDAANKALLESLGSVSGKLKVGVIGSLGVRGEDSSVSALAELVADDDQMVANAAANALGAIHSASAAKALETAKPTDAVLNARLSCAEGVLASGDAGVAKSIYQKLMTNPAKHIKLAATRGMLSCAAQ